MIKVNPNCNSSTNFCANPSTVAKNALNKKPLLKEVTVDSLKELMTKIDSKWNDYFAEKVAIKHKWHLFKKVEMTREELHKHPEIWELDVYKQAKLKYNNLDDYTGYRNNVSARNFAKKSESIIRNFPEFTLVDLK